MFQATNRKLCGRRQKQIISKIIIDSFSFFQVKYVLNGLLSYEMKYYNVTKCNKKFTTKIGNFKSQQRYKVTYKSLATFLQL